LLPYILYSGYLYHIHLYIWLLLPSVTRHSIIKVNNLSHGLSFRYSRLKVKKFWGERGSTTCTTLCIGSIGILHMIPSCYSFLLLSSSFLLLLFFLLFYFLCVPGNWVQCLLCKHLLMSYITCPFFLGNEILKLDSGADSCL
jgi:hypothetical protein